MEKVNFYRLHEFLREHEDLGLNEFRSMFDAALFSRDFNRCKELLAVVESIESEKCHHAYLHYQGVYLFHEYHQFEKAEYAWRSLLAERCITTTQKARTANALGILLGGELAQWGEAERYYQIAIEGYQEGNDQLGLARVQNNLGIMNTFRYEQIRQNTDLLIAAQKYHEQAIATCERRLTDDPSNAQFGTELIRNQHGLAKALAWQKEYAGAIEAFERLLKQCQSGDYEFERAAGLSDSAALVHLPLEDYREAENAVEEAIRLFMKQDESLYRVEAEARLGNIYEAKGEVSKAVSQYRSAIHLAETMRQQMATSDTQARYRAVTDFVYSAPLTLYLRQNQAADALTLAETARSRALVDLVASPQDSGESARLDEFRRVREQLRGQIGAPNIETLNRPQIDDRNRELNNLDRQIELERSRTIELNRMDALNEAEIRAALPPQSALLTYVSDSESHFHALVVTSKSVEHVPISTRITQHWLQKLLTDYLDGRQKGLIPITDDDKLPNIALFSQLYHAFVKPILPHVEPSETLYIAPTGPLNYLPVGALRENPQHSSALLDNRRIVYTPSATLLFRYCHKRNASPYTSTITFAPKEADLNFSQGAAASLTQGDADLRLIDDLATREAFLVETSKHRIINFWDMLTLIQSIRCSRI